MIIGNMFFKESKIPKPKDSFYVKFIFKVEKNDRPSLIK